MDRTIREILVILVLGLLISAGSWITLSDSAAILFGFVYVMLIPIVHEVANYDEYV